MLKSEVNVCSVLFYFSLFLKYDCAMDTNAKGNHVRYIGIITYSEEKSATVHALLTSLL